MKHIPALKKTFSKNQTPAPVRLPSVGEVEGPMKDTTDLLQELDDYDVAMRTVQGGEVFWVFVAPTEGEQREPERLRTQLSRTTKQADKILEEISALIHKMIRRNGRAYLRQREKERQARIAV